MADEPTYPKLVGGRWIASPLTHLGVYAARAERDGEPLVAVPRDLLLRVSRWQECGVRRSFASDEDGLLPAPVEVACRREREHDRDGHPTHVRDHSNGYFTWPAAERDLPPGSSGVEAVDHG